VRSATTRWSKTVHSAGAGTAVASRRWPGARAIAGAAGQSSFDDVVVAARRGDERAREALRRAAAYIGIAVANLTIFLTPQRIVVGGGMAEAGELRLEPLHAEVKRRAGRVAPLEAIEIVRATLDADAGAIGAALAGADGDTR
jgi:glucokinase